MTTEIQWTENGVQRTARWQSEAGLPPPKKMRIANDEMKGDEAFHLASEGTALLWYGDFHNAKQLLGAMARRVDARAERSAGKAVDIEIGTADAFNRHRMMQGQRARTLGMLLLPFNADHTLPLGRAPDVVAACTEAYGEVTEPYVASLRELLGVIGAHEWRKRGVEVKALRDKIHPHYGVFAPIRSEYVDLVAKVPMLPHLLPAMAGATAFDIGTGTGILAAILAKRGIGTVIATEMDDRALACAQENLKRLGLLAGQVGPTPPKNAKVGKVTLVKTDMFPEGSADLIVCNPPWLPARPSASLERAVYDEDGRMLAGFLSGVAAHLKPEGEAWLILSDLAEHLGLRSRESLQAAIEAGGLTVLGRMDINPYHPKATESTDRLAAARRAEVTSLWRLGKR